MKLSRYKGFSIHIVYNMHFSKASYLGENFFETSEFFMQASVTGVFIIVRSQIKIRKYDFFETCRLLQGSLEYRHIKNWIASPNLNKNPNPFRVFTRTLCTIYRQKIIEIGRGHVERFPGQLPSSVYALVYISPYGNKNNIFAENENATTKSTNFFPRRECDN